MNLCYPQFIANYQLAANIAAIAAISMLLACLLDFADRLHATSLRIILLPPK
jgi:hypothetical protein